MVLVDKIGLFGLDGLDPKGWTYVQGARAGRQGLEIMEERDEQQNGKGRTMEEREERHEQ